jgi:CubicO group peptidase (beta-lactamase class C family)
MSATRDGFATLRGVCQAGAAAGVVPGGVILCADAGSIRHQEAFGARQIEPEPLAATIDTVYDVASVTKAAVTSVLAMHAVGTGKLGLDDAVIRHIPEFQGEGKASVTVRQLLCHASGLPAHRPFHERVAAGPSGRAAIALAAAQEPLVFAPGTGAIYSDLGFMVLGWLLERATGLGLDVQADRVIFGPLGLASARFVNLNDGKARAQLLASAPVAPTERCPVRGGITVGEVHDLNAFAMGGIAGHAGLFIDAPDLGRIAAALSAAWRGNHASPIVDSAVIREFWRPSGIAGSTWRLGWDGPAERDSQAGGRLSRAAVGHLGFTGCSIWIDPNRALWIVLLTNRVHPEVSRGPGFKTFRAAVHDAAMEALDGLDGATA